MNHIPPFHLRFAPYSPPVAIWAGSLLFTFLQAYLAWHIVISLEPTDFFASCNRYDGVHYGDIASVGYTYSATGKSNTAFFPGFPLVAWACSRLTGLQINIALLFIANLCVLIAFVLFYRYAQERTGIRKESDSERGVKSFPDSALMIMAFWPTTFFWRMGYSESLFMALSLSAFRGMQVGRSPWLIALLIGAATSTRSVGVALLPPFLWYLYRYSRDHSSFIFKSLILAPLACWGLIAYLLYLWLAFDDPLIFATTQQYWRIHPPSEGLWDKLTALLSMEPIWSVYVPGMPGYWHDQGTPTSAMINWQFANPIYFVLAGLLVAIGFWKHWLNAPEILFSIGLLLIPYLTRGYEMCMSSHGRFASVVFPVYFVLGNLYQRLPNYGGTMLLIFISALYAAYVSTFVCGYLVF